MPRPKRTVDEIEVMRERILDSAMQLLRDAGSEGLSVRAIAERVGISHMSIYSFFENQGDLFQALRERQRGQLMSAHEAALEAARAGDVEGAVREVLMSYTIFAENRPNMFRFMWNLQGECCKRGKPGRQSGKSGMRRGMRILSEIIALGVKQNLFSVRDEQMAAMIVSGAVNGAQFMVQHISGEDEIAEATRLGEETIEMCILYLKNSGRQDEIYS